MAAPIKRVLIVSPHFPPINAPDHQRIRTALPFLEEYGWKAAVLAVHAKYVEGVEDSLLEKTFPATTRIVRTRALSVRLTRLFGVGSVALRALPFLWMAGNKLLRNERTFDLIFFSTTMFPVLILEAEVRNSLRRRLSGSVDERLLLPRQTNSPWRSV